MAVPKSVDLLHHISPYLHDKSCLKRIHSIAYCFGFFVFCFLYFSILFFFFLIYFVLKFYNIVLVLPNIEMNLPQVYPCSPS